jgi:transcriptional regulator with XRE-family HTH domain
MKKHIGSSFSNFLREEGIQEEVDLLAKKKVIADELVAEMERAQVSRSKLASRLHSSRTLVNRLLDPADTSITLSTLVRVASALDLDFRISFKPSRRKRAA